jgi:hypothetical protein
MGRRGMNIGFWWENETEGETGFIWLRIGTT